MDRFIVTLATGIGIGYFPIFPGTMGTVLAIPIDYFLSEVPFPFYAITLGGFFFLAVWVSEKTGAIFGRKDDPRIVIDEIAGFFLTMLGIPRKPLFIAVGFILFRFFDIVKPPPIRFLERAPGGYGVVLDDVMAGTYANILLRLIYAIL